MTEIKQNGLVIKEQDLGENDKLLIILTERYGKLPVIGKGVKSLKNRHIVSTQPFAYSTFDLRKRGNFYYIIDSDLIENYYDIRNDILKLALASYICDVVCDVTDEGREDDMILKLALNTLFAIAKNKKSLEMIRASFEIRLATECGFMPDINCCSMCGTTEVKGAYLDIMEGNLICEKCKDSVIYANAENPFSNAGLEKPMTYITLPVINTINYITHSRQERFLSFNLEKDEQKCFCDACEKFLLNHLERGFYSLDFYKSLL